MSTFISYLRKSITGLERYPAFLLVAWLILLIALPFLWRAFGIQIMLQGLALGVLVQVLIVLNVLYRSWGWWSMLRVAAGVILLAWAAYAIGIRSGYPFGSIRFSEILQPQVMDVPILIPLMWLMMLPSAWAVAKLVTRKVNGCLMRPAFILVSAIAFTAWSCYLEPLLAQWGVTSWKAAAGGYFGTPWSSFTGWMIVSALITFAIAPKRLPGGLLVVVYVLTWLVGSISLLTFWGLILPGLVLFLLMGGIVSLAAINSG